MLSFKNQLDLAMMTLHIILREKIIDIPSGCKAFGYVINIKDDIGCLISYRLLFKSNDPGQYIVQAFDNAALMETGSIVFIRDDLTDLM